MAAATTGEFNVEAISDYPRYRMTSVDLAERILGSIAASRFDDLGTDLLEAAVRYARLRVDWALAPVELRKGMDRERTLAHNVLIDAFNILSRAMAKGEEDTSWRAQLGSERGFIGDVACHMHCILGIRAR